MSAQRGKGTMALEGTLDVFRLPEILQVISHQRKTGILTVQGENDIVAVSFLDGAVVAADALNQTVEEKLGDVLEREGIASREQFAEVAAEAQQGEGRLLDLLVERSVVERSGLLAAIRAQTYDVLLELLAWDTGEYKFYSGDEVSYEEGFAPIPIEELLLRSIAETAEDDAGEALPAEGAVYQRIEPPPREIQERVGPPRPGEESDAVLWLSEDENRVYRELATPHSVEALRAATGLGEHKVRFALYRLLHGSVAETVETGDSAEPEPLAAPPPLPEPPPKPEPPPPPSLRPVEMPGEDTLAGLTQDPEPVPKPVRRPVPAGRGVAAVAHLLALLLAVGAGAALVAAPDRFVLPFPWQGSERAAEATERFDAAAVKVERAAKTWYLLEGGFPDSLGRLVDAGMLARTDLAAPGGGPYAYGSDADSYRLRPPGSPADVGAGEAITGNFLLDGDFHAGHNGGQGPPLVLLD